MVGAGVAQDDAASTASNLANFQDDGDEVDDDDVEDGDGDDSGSGVGPEGEGVLADQVWSHSQFQTFFFCWQNFPAFLPATLTFRFHPVKGFFWDADTRLVVGVTLQNVRHGTFTQFYIYV